MVRVLFLTGAPGTGKSTVLSELGSILERDQVQHSLLESEALSQGWPLLAAEQWIAQLDAVLALQRDAGRQLFLIAGTPETDEQLASALAVMRADTVLVAGLRAAAETVAARLSAREPDSWPGKGSLIARARRLAEAMPSLAGLDVLIDTDERGAADVALTLHALMGTHGLLR